MTLHLMKRLSRWSLVRVEGLDTPCNLQDPGKSPAPYPNLGMLLRECVVGLSYLSAPKTGRCTARQEKLSLCVLPPGLWLQAWERILSPAKGYNTCGVTITEIFTSVGEKMSHQIILLRCVQKTA